MEQHEFESAAATFLERLDKTMQLHRLELEPHWDIDHLCFRTSTNERYQAVCKAMSQIGMCLSETCVNGRMIACFRIAMGFEFRGRTIDLIEVPAPKEGKHTAEGFEHIEVVVDCSFSTLESKFSPELKSRVRRPGLQKRFNPEVEISFGDISVKFHHQSLSQVIECELEATRSTQLKAILQWPGLQNCELIFLKENGILIFDPYLRVSSLVRTQIISELSKLRGHLIFEHAEAKLQAHLAPLHRSLRESKYGERRDTFAALRDG